jgi:hypothetical protein
MHLVELEAANYEAVSSWEASATSVSPIYPHSIIVPSTASVSDV